MKLRNYTKNIIHENLIKGDEGSMWLLTHFSQLGSFYTPLKYQ